MIDVQAAAELSSSCLQRNEFWVGVIVHLSILLLVFGTIAVWNRVKGR